VSAGALATAVDGLNAIPKPAASPTPSTINIAIPFFFI